jgi:hypothetical protein
MDTVDSAFGEIRGNYAMLPRALATSCERWFVELRFDCNLDLPLVQRTGAYLLAANTHAYTRTKRTYHPGVSDAAAETGTELEYYVRSKEGWSHVHKLRIQQSERTL